MCALGEGFVNEYVQHRDLGTIRGAKAEMLRLAQELLSSLIVSADLTTPEVIDEPPVEQDRRTVVAAGVRPHLLPHQPLPFAQ